MKDIDKIIASEWFVFKIIYVWPEKLFCTPLTFCETFLSIKQLSFLFSGNVVISLCEIPRNAYTDI